MVEQAAVESADQHGAAQMNDGLTRRFAPRITHTVAASVAGIADESGADAVSVSLERIAGRLLECETIDRDGFSLLLGQSRPAHGDDCDEACGAAKATCVPLTALAVPQDKSKP